MTFADALRAAMTRRHLTVRALAAETGLARATICAWRSGETMPTFGNVDLVATALADLRLRAIGHATHFRRCPVCRREFVTQMRNGRRIYCSRKCEHTASGRRRRKRVEHPYRVAKMRLEDARAAIAAFCRSCEPLGCCRDNACPLRSQSPLPFVPLSAVHRRIA